MAKRRKHRVRRRRGRSRSPVTTLRRRHVYATNPRRKHRRHHYRRNPFGGGVVKLAVQGVKDASAIVVGKAATRVVSNLIPIGTNAGVIGAVKQVAVAVGVGYAASKLVKRGDFARFVTAGGIAGALETIVKGLNIPILSANLGDGGEFTAIGPGAGGSSFINSPGGVGAYPGSMPAGVGAYPLGDLGDGMGELGMMGAM